MEQGFLSPLDGLSPWWWVAFAIALMVAEMLTGGFFLIWSGVAALLVAFALLAMPALSGEWQIVLFSVGTLLLILAGRPLVRRHRAHTDDHPTLNRRTSSLPGRQARVTEPVGRGEGEVEIDGVRWRARRADGEGVIPRDALATILAAESTVVVVCEAGKGSGETPVGMKEGERTRREETQPRLE